MGSALIGHSGFVGSTLKKQKIFDDFYRSTNLADIGGKSYDRVVCAAAPAQKWLANKNPEQDRATIAAIVEKLSTFECRQFVLVSTVDVFRTPQEVDEDSPADDPGNGAYGLHRRELEKFVQQRFDDHLIVRLPGLVGPGLRKNVIYDFQHDNNVASIDSRGVFQFYPMINLWYDIQTALDHQLKLVHLTAEPVSVADVSLHGFGRPFENVTSNMPARYDMRTKHAAAFGGSGHYQYSVRDTVQAVRGYAQSEAPAAEGTGT